jgi:putative Holliday junction resolvase
MGIDYGTKRIGIAVTDTMKIIASVLKTVENKEIFDFLAEYLKAEVVECIVIGDPQRSDGSDSPIKKQIDNFAKKIQTKYPEIKVARYNEQYSSQRAEAAIRASGAKKKKRRDKALVDTISAAIILQDYMNDNFW